MMMMAFVRVAGATGLKSQTGLFTPINRNSKYIKILKPVSWGIAMSEPPEENYQLAVLINKDFGSTEEGLIISSDIPDRNIIREKLAILIAHLMENNFEKLCQAMYRLDVSEAKFDRVMNNQPLEEIPYAVADLVIEREMQKVRTRIMHKRGDL